MVEPSFQPGLFKSQSGSFLLLDIQINKQICSDTWEKVAVFLFHPEIMGLKKQVPKVIKICFELHC